MLVNLKNGLQRMLKLPVGGALEIKGGGREGRGVQLGCLPPPTRSLPQWTPRAES